EQVQFENGMVRPTDGAAGKAKPMSLADLAKVAGKTGGPIGGVGRINAQGAGPSFGTHLVDVEVDPETGRVTILRYTMAQDAGKALHPSYVEGQYQGGAAQGVGWALNEEYIYGPDGKLQNAGFLDYRMPVASDLPMIDAIIVEVPNPRHPYGVRGVGETPIVPPMAAIANAIEQATGIRFTELPMSPPKVLKALKEKGLNKPSNGKGNGAPKMHRYRRRGEGGECRNPRAAQGGRRRVRSGGGIREGAVRATEPAPPGARPPSRGGRGRGDRWPDLPGRAPRADRTHQRGVH